MRSILNPFIVPPGGVNLLPVDIHGGVHPDLMAPGTLTFVLYAPFKPFISLVGDFNDWDTRANPLITDGRGVWWTTIPHPGETRYGYYVAIDELSHTWVGDPYATQVVWSEAGPWGYLPAVPSTFPWSDQGWRTPPLRDLVIYELCMRDFAGSWQGNHPRYGDLHQMLTHLDYLAEMGVNAVELMPIQAFPGDSSWGYNPVFFFALANSYGQPNDFKRFVDGCHARGIAVILDVAFNHAWGEHPYYQFYPPMYGPNGEWLDDWNPFFHHTPRAVNSWGGVDWDHFAPETTRHFQDVMRFWLQEYHVDGFRFDWVCGVDYDSRDPMNPGCNPYHGISAIAWAAHQVKPDCILVGEYWQLEGTHPDKTAAKIVQEGGLDACWHGAFHHTLDDILNQRWEWEKLDIFRAIGGFRQEGFTTATQVINYSCSHDEVRPEHEILYYSQSHIQRPADMSVYELARAKALLGLITLFTAPGVPMLYAGQEFAEDAPRTIDFQPLHWDKLTQFAHLHYYQIVKRLICARKTYSALRSDQIEFYVNNFAMDQVVRFQRWSDNPTSSPQGQPVLVALNFSAFERTIDLPIPSSGLWRDWVSDRVYRVANNTWSTTLAPWQGVILGKD